MWMEFRDVSRTPTKICDGVSCSNSYEFLAVNCCYKALHLKSEYLIFGIYTLFYKQHQAEIGEKSSKSYATP